MRSETAITVNRALAGVASLADIELFFRVYFHSSFAPDRARHGSVISLPQLLLYPPLLLQLSLQLLVLDLLGVDGLLLDDLLLLSRLEYVVDS